jgi:hypothetical protein
VVVARSLLVPVIVALAATAGCDDEPPLPPAWAIGLEQLDAQALGLVDAAHPAAVVPALAQLTDRAFSTLPTPDGSGQAIDPDVIVDVADPAASRILLVATPFPYSDARAENPSVFASTDGAAFDLPAAGASNPIVAPLDVGHNAEPDLRYDPKTGTYTMLYLADRPAAQVLEVLTSIDLVSWTDANPDPLIFNQAGGDHTVASPTTWLDAANTTWLFLIDTTAHALFSLTSTNGVTWDLATKQTLAIDLAGVEPHKIDLVGGPTGGYVLLITGAPAGEPTDRVYAATSTDLQTWTFNAAPVIFGLPNALTLGRASGAVSGSTLWVWFAREYDPN